MADHGAAEALAKAMPQERELLREEVLRLLPNGLQWMMTPHELLNGDTPEQRISTGDLKPVRDLLYSILYVGMT